jgi:hypothetical protein
MTIEAKKRKKNATPKEIRRNPVINWIGIGFFKYLWEEFFDHLKDS